MQATVLLPIILSECIPLIFFYLFLFFFYRSFSGIYQEPHNGCRKKEIIIAAVMLACYAWFKPSGQLIAVLAALVLAFCAQCTLRVKLKKIALFLCVFFLCMSPRYIQHIPVRHPEAAHCNPLHESAKTTFDLYTNQLIAYVNDCDLTLRASNETRQDCLYKTAMPWEIQLIFYFELIYMLLLWTGLFAGFWTFFIVPLYKRMKVPPFIAHQFGLWLKILPMILGILFMTCKSGHGQLRLLIEPLLITLSLTFWQRLWAKRNK